MPTPTPAEAAAIPRRTALPITTTKRDCIPISPRTTHRIVLQVIMATTTTMAMAMAMCRFARDTPPMIALTIAVRPKAGNPPQQDQPQHRRRRRPRQEEEEPSRRYPREEERPLLRLENRAPAPDRASNTTNRRRRDRRNNRRLRRPPPPRERHRKGEEEEDETTKAVAVVPRRPASPTPAAPPSAGPPFINPITWPSSTRTCDPPRDCGCKPTGRAIFCSTIRGSRSKPPTKATGPPAGIFCSTPASAR